MTGASTTREDVERMAAELCARWDDAWALLECREQAAATLRALLDERDRLARMHATAFDAAVDAQAERDAARAECEAHKARADRYDTEAACASILRAEVERVRAAWLLVIQAENSCVANGRCVNAKRCGCVEEMEMLIREHAPALAGAPRHE